MKVQKQDLGDGSCNFCTPSYQHDMIIFNYDYVYLIQRDSNNGLAATICPDCVNELIEKTKDD